MTPAFAELVAATNFSFLAGASHAQEMVGQAAALGLTAIGIADRNTLAGVVRAHVAAKEAGIKLLVGARLVTTDGFEVVCYPQDRVAYGRLCRLLTLGNRRAPKGECHLTLSDIVAHAQGQILIAIPPRTLTPAFAENLATLVAGTLPPVSSTPEGNSSSVVAFPRKRPASEDMAALACPDASAGFASDARGAPPLPFAFPDAARERSDPGSFPEEMEPQREKIPALAALRREGNGGDERRTLEPGHTSGEPGGAANVFLALTLAFDGREKQRAGALMELSERAGAPLVATTDALFHHPSRKPLADILTCISEKCTIAQAGYRLAANAERHLKPAVEMARLYARMPEMVTRSLEIANRVNFSLDELRYEYPDEPVPPGKTPQGYLEEITHSHARERYPNGIPAKVQALIEKELALIAELRYAEYFLTVYDLVRFARSKKILCQGRGAAANSAVCFCLGITSVDPTQIDLLFERFISADRGEPPDIDVDFEHERREEVIQYLYERYGRHRAAICATVIHYRPRMAIREVGKALGFTEDVTAALSGLVWGYGDGAFPEEHIREAGLDPDNPELRQALLLANMLLGFPRHLSQHVGGFVLTRHRLDETVPILNAAMEDRTNIEWDKDDIDALGILKVDVLALGMLSAIRKSFDLIEKHYGWRPTLAMEPTDKRVYDMLSRADSVGVFQVESRAQMSMLPRLKPACFYDLVIEVAIVRPGPIQGDMVHPYLRRRDGIEPVSYPSKALEAVLSKTMGVPLFQEQAMQIAIVGAGFTPGEADKLRRAMATFRHVGTIHTFRERFIDGMLERGYQAEFAERCFSQIEGFGEYGFPESHAASFALLVYVSAWIKCYFPEVFCAALINSQPMGFYQPAQLVRDAREHAVAVLPPDVNASDWDCTLEPAGDRYSGRAPTELSFLAKEKATVEPLAACVEEARSSATGSPSPLWGGDRGGGDPAISVPDSPPPCSSPIRGEETQEPYALYLGGDVARVEIDAGTGKDPGSRCARPGTQEEGGVPHPDEFEIGAKGEAPLGLPSRQSCATRLPEEARDGVRDARIASEAAPADQRTFTDGANPLGLPSRQLCAMRLPDEERDDVREVRIASEDAPADQRTFTDSVNSLDLPSRKSCASTIIRDLSPSCSDSTRAKSNAMQVPGLQGVGAQARFIPPDRSRPAVRLGLRLVSGLQKVATEETVLARRGEGYTDIPTLWLRSQAPAALLERLADADAFRSLGLDRRQALWAVKGLEGGALKAGHKRSGRARAPIFAKPETGDLFAEAGVNLPATTLGEHVVEDYSALGLSLKAHPVSFFRQRLKAMGVISSAEHWEAWRAGKRAKVAGLVLVRQRPGTAKGVIFLTMEDETGVVNVVVWPKMFEKFRRIVMSAQLLMVRGRIERHGLVSHVIAEDLVDLSRELATLSSGTPLAHEGREVQEGSWRPKSRDFH